MRRSSTVQRNKNKREKQRGKAYDCCGPWTESASSVLEKVINPSSVVEMDLSSDVVSLAIVTVA